MQTAEMDLLDVDPFDLLADEEPFVAEPVAASEPAVVQAIRNPFRKYKRDRIGQFATTDGGGSAPVKADPRVGAMRTDFAERVSRAGTDQGALAAVPAKFSYDIDETSTSYRGKGQLKGPNGVGSSAALETYQSTDEYELLNKFSRGMLDSQSGPGHAPPRMAKAQRQHIESSMADIDATLAASPLDRDVVVHRVVQSGADLFGPIWGSGEDIGPQDFAKVAEVHERRKTGWRPDMTGMRFTDHGFMSTSAGDKWPKKWASQWQRPGEADEPVMFRILVPKGTGAVQMSDSGEMEVLLERGLSMEVVQDHGVGKDGIRHLDLRVVEANADN